MIRRRPSLYLLCLTLASNYFARLAPTAAWSISNSRAIPSRTGRLRRPALSSTKPSTQQTAEELPLLVQSGPVSPIPQKSYGKGVWVPPSRNVAQRKGKVFSIRQPQDLLDFVIEDERLSVVKVYASWCKTCQVFDVRYRKLASQYGDTYDSAGTHIDQYGRVRFGEMEYDQNEEMCRLLNATKLPYIIMYKGSKGKVAEFQCGPGKFQKLIDAVNEFADSEEDVAGGVLTAVVDGNATFVPQNAELEQSPRSDVVTDDVERLKHQITVLNKEKIELFEVMMADLEYHKEQIQKLNDELAKQRATHQESVQAKDFAVTNLTDTLTRQQKQFDEEVSSLSGQIEGLSKTILQHEETIQSLEVKLSVEQRKREAENLDSRRHSDELKSKIALYESERHSLRKLSILAVKRVGRGVGSFISRLRLRR
ncbi:hypothetical protein ACHAWX_005748 [Stephanocyclus meneghinianus]